MQKTYSVPTHTPMKVEELQPVTATALKNSTADVLDQVVAQGALAVTRHDKPRAVLISVEQYERMIGAESSWLGDLHKEYRGMLEEMQAPSQKAAAKRAFNATPEELGKAAVAAARKR